MKASVQVDRAICAFCCHDKKEVLDSNKKNCKAWVYTIAFDQFENDILTEIKCKIPFICQIQLQKKLD